MIKKTENKEPNKVEQFFLRKNIQYLVIAIVLISTLYIIINGINSLNLFQSKKEINKEFIQYNYKDSTVRVYYSVINNDTLFNKYKTITIPKQEIFITQNMKENKTHGATITKKNDDILSVINYQKGHKNDTATFYSLYPLKDRLEIYQNDTIKAVQYYTNKNEVFLSFTYSSNILTKNIINRTPDNLDGTYFSKNSQIEISSNSISYELNNQKYTSNFKFEYPPKLRFKIPQQNEETLYLTYFKNDTLILESPGINTQFLSRIIYTKI